MFDHTIADSNFGAHAPGAKMPPPMEGAIDALKRLISMGYQIVVFTARATTASGKKAVEDWMRYFGIPCTVTAIKDHTIKLFIDDRGYHFESWSKTMRDFPMAIAREMQY